MPHAAPRALRTRPARFHRVDLGGLSLVFFPVFPNLSLDDCRFAPKNERSCKRAGAGGLFKGSLAHTAVLAACSSSQAHSFCSSCASSALLSPILAWDLGHLEWSRPLISAATFGGEGDGRAEQPVCRVVSAGQDHAEAVGSPATLAAPSRRRPLVRLVEAGSSLTCASWLVVRQGRRRPEEVDSTSSSPFPPQVPRLRERPERLQLRGHDPRLGQARRDRVRGAFFCACAAVHCVSCFGRRARVSGRQVLIFGAAGAYARRHSRIRRDLCI